METNSDKVQDESSEEIQTIESKLISNSKDNKRIVNSNPCGEISRKTSSPDITLKNPSDKFSPKKIENVKSSKTIVNSSTKVKNYSISTNKLNTDRPIYDNDSEDEIYIENHNVNVFKKHKSIELEIPEVVCYKNEEESRIDNIIDELYKDEVSNSDIQNKIEWLDENATNKYILHKNGLSNKKEFSKHDRNLVQAPKYESTKYGTSMAKDFIKKLSAPSFKINTADQKTDYTSFTGRNLTGLSSPNFTKRNSMRSYCTQNQKNLTSDARVKTNVSQISTARSRCSDQKLTNVQKHKLRYSLEQDPMELLKFKKKLDFPINTYEPKVVTENHHWDSKKKIRDYEEPLINSLNEKHGNKFMLTRADKIRSLKKGKDSQIKAFTKQDEQECAAGDCDRFFNVNLKQIDELRKPHKELSHLKGTFLYRISKDTSFKREIDQAQFLMRLKRNEDIHSGIMADQITTFATDIKLDVDVGIVKDEITNKMNEKEALTKA